ncbi:protein translocase subunit SecF [Candidatus Parcubacteria bacterium]|nr:MAG: protein translocase subunit SecF [Candidatus Parcubacteria bacterium]
MLDIVGKRKIYFTLSGILVGAAIVAIIVFGFKQGIDFVGGSLWKFRVPLNQPSSQELEAAFQVDLGLGEVRMNYEEGSGVFFVRLPAVNEIDHQKFLNILRNKFPSFQELSFESIGPSIGNELRRKAFIGVALVLLGISFYIAFAFRKTSRPVSSWKYGWITLLTLFHDAIIPAGLFSTLGYFFKIEVDTNFIVALLVVVGFSVHDTIVVFDRIRENLTLNRGRSSFETVVNESVNQTLGRSVNTSLTLILVLIALYITGPSNLHYFVLTLLVGVTTGIYSSIFVASPALLLVTPKDKRI